MTHTSYLLLDRLEIQAANTISSPLTYGFPAITGFVGAIHALGRRLPAENGISLGGVLIASHQCSVQQYRPHSYADYTFNQTRNPIKKDGKTAAIVEEGKVNLTVSLVIEVNIDRQAHKALRESADEFEQTIKQLIMQQRIAGGSVFNMRSIKWFESTSRDLQRALLPAFVLMDAQNDLAEITEEIRKNQPQATALDALIDVETMHHIPPDTEQKETEWRATSVKTGRGWLVPIPIGFQGIAPLIAPSQLANSRNPEYPSQYVECVYSLGKWVFPYRLNDLSACFWRYSQPQNNLYLVTQTNDKL
ncbi:type I-F CRISPR-associated protein Csy2 [Zhongshania guokunii]|uniref:Type I-F CRISPR-associated protein Csy2 n=1 Tax=Zhongshania guokunii TaxID=641783 RepID=A0ABV3U800_9GAMM